MNIQLVNVISDLAGLTGQKIIREIVAGKRATQVLAAYRDARIIATGIDLANPSSTSTRVSY